MLDYTTVDDAGRLLNPLLAEGQVRGGFAHGAGAALFEQVVYDEDGNLLTGPFMDYVCPTPPTCHGSGSATARRRRRSRRSARRGSAREHDEHAGRDRERSRRRDRRETRRGAADPRPRLGAASVKPPPFEYVRAESLEEALAALAQAGPDAKLLAGGQSLAPLLNLRLAAPSVLVDLNGISDLDAIRPENGSVRIGALARQARSPRSSCATACPLAEALRTSATLQPATAARWAARSPMPTAAPSCRSR